MPGNGKPTESGQATKIYDYRQDGKPATPQKPEKKEEAKENDNE